MRFWILVLSFARMLPRSAGLLHAQFQEPSKAELQMTEEPKAPGLAAVYLNISECSLLSVTSEMFR